MTFTGYTKRDTNIIKGFAILCIVFHNYFHWLWPSPGENEFDFSTTIIPDFFAMVGRQPGEFINLLFSCFGHYGVQLFILLSGYGLATKWNGERRTESPSFSVFRKLYPLLLTGVVVCFLGCVLMNGRMFTSEEWWQIGYKLLFIHTLIPNAGLSVNGPWWFFGLIFQLYLLFPLLFHWIKKGRWKAFLVVLAFSYGLMFLFREALNLHHGTILMQNAPGHLPEFCLGIWLAFSKGKNIHWLWLVLALVLFVWGNFSPGFYPFTFLSLCVITVFATQSWKSKTEKWEKVFRSPFSVLHYFGGISMLLFVVHGYFREPVLKLAETMNGSLWHLVSGLLYFFLVWGIALAAKPLYLWLLRLSEKLKVKSFPFFVLFLLFYLYVGVYYIRQNLTRYPDRPLTAEKVINNGKVSPENESSTVARFRLKGNPLMIHISGGFDYKSETEQLPLFVIDIDDVLWETMELPTSQEDEWTHYEFCYDYPRSFINRIDGKALSFYLWNPNQGALQFRNFSIFAYY